MDMRKAKLVLGLKECRFRHMNKMGAISAVGAIVLIAESSEDHQLRQNFAHLNNFLSPGELSAERYFAGTMLFQMVAETEFYFSEAIQQVVTAYPQKLGSETFRLADVIGKTEDEMVQIAADRFLYSLMYKKPVEYLEEFCKVLSIPTDALKSLWPTFVEAKARRDLGMHNNWVVNETYLRKLSEAGGKSEVTKGSRICPTHEYVHPLINEFEMLAKTLDEQLMAKYSVS